MSALEYLIAQLQASLGPSRALDREIEALLDLGEFGVGPQAYTGLLDSALTLIPPGWVRSVDATVPGAGVDVDLYVESKNFIAADAVKVRGTHTSEALATCIAALKVRAAP